MTISTVPKSASSSSLPASHLPAIRFGIHRRPVQGRHRPQQNARWAGARQLSQLWPQGPPGSAILQRRGSGVAERSEGRCLKPPARGLSRPGMSLPAVATACEQPSAVGASRPAARSARASAQLVDADLDAAPPGRVRLWRSDPTDPLVSRQWGDIDPEPLRRRVSLDGFTKICRQLVHRAACHLLSRHT